MLVPALEMRHITWARDAAHHRNPSNHAKKTRPRLSAGGSAVRAAWFRHPGAWADVSANTFCEPLIPFYFRFSVRVPISWAFRGERAMRRVCNADNLSVRAFKGPSKIFIRTRAGETASQACGTLTR